MKEFNDFFGGDSKLGWIIKKADKNFNSEDLNVQNADQIKPYSEGDVKIETVNGEDKMSFGPTHSSSSEMEAMTRCNKLSPSTTYIYRTWAQYTDGKQTKVIYGEVKELTTMPSENEPRCETDLGLSVNWACYNVGAANSSQYGNYYAWGEMDTKKEYTAANYKVPGKEKIAGDTNYDVATTWNKGKNSGWRMPTKEEFQELIDNCKMEWTTLNKVKGMKFTSKINGKSIFLPAAGMPRRPTATASEAVTGAATSIQNRSRLMWTMAVWRTKKMRMRMKGK